MFLSSLVGNLDEWSSAPVIELDVREEKEKVTRDMKVRFEK